MPQRPRDIGTAVESATVNYLNNRNCGLYARREVLHGREDRGDVHVVTQANHLIVIECKAGRSAESASLEQIERWVNEAEREAGHAGADYAFLVTKVAGRGTARAGDWALHWREPWGVTTARLSSLPKIIETKTVQL